MKTHILVNLLAICALLPSTVAVSAQLRVVTTTTDLADIVKHVGGNQVSVVSLAKGNQDLHFVEPRPSMVNDLRKADVFVKIGMDQDIWSEALVDAARNKKIVRGAKGHIDTSVGIKKLEVPTGRVDASQGHVHVYGNPHFWLNPLNGKIIARNVLQGLIRAAPQHGSSFTSNYERFCKKIDANMPKWQSRLRPFKGTKIVSYHKSWAYFNQAFGLASFGTVEPLPGIPPSPSHANELIKRMKNDKVPLILMETFYPKRFPEMIAKATGAKVLAVPASVGGSKTVNDYFDLFDHLTAEIAKALR